METSDKLTTTHKNKTLFKAAALPASILLSLITIFFTATNFRLVDLDNYTRNVQIKSQYIERKEVEASFILKTFVADNYIPIEVVDSDYLSRTSVNENFISIQELNNKYVIRELLADDDFLFDNRLVPFEKYELTNNNYLELYKLVHGIPDKYRVQNIDLRTTKSWKNENLGVSVEVLREYGAPGDTTTIVNLVTPITPNGRQLSIKDSRIEYVFTKYSRSFVLAFEEDQTGKLIMSIVEE